MRRCAGTAARGCFDEQRAGCDDQLFVCNGDVDAALDCGKDCFERHRSVGRSEHDLRIALHRDPVQAGRSVPSSARDPRAERAGLFAEQLDVAPRGETDDLELIAVTSDHVERLRPDRSG